MSYTIEFNVSLGSEQQAFGSNPFLADFVGAKQLATQPTTYPDSKSYVLDKSYVSGGDLDQLATSTGSNSGINYIYVTENEAQKSAFLRNGVVERGPRSRIMPVLIRVVSL